jgi:hypothetical protein
MLNQNHPADERLSALASLDTDATTDAALGSHVSSCDRCTELVSDLDVLRVALADLPDLQPSRPLQLLPPVEVESSGVDRLGGWARRFFAPILASGAALALVGVIGTAAPALEQMASGPGAQGAAASQAAQEFAAPAASEAGEQPTTFDAAGGDDSDGGGGDMESAASPPAAERDENAVDEQRTASSNRDVSALEQTTASAERSPWPMVLFAGAALMVGAFLMRWILVPRGG